MPKRKPKRKIIIRRKKIDPKELVDEAHSLGLTGWELLAFQNQKNREKKGGRQKGFRGEYGKRFDPNEKIKMRRD